MYVLIWQLSNTFNPSTLKSSCKNYIENYEVPLPVSRSQAQRLFNEFYPFSG